MYTTLGANQWVCGQRFFSLHTSSSKVSERNEPVKNTLYNYYENGISFVLSAEQGLEAGIRYRHVLSMD